MKIVYVAPMYDYGDPSRGYSFEHHNFYDTLAHMGLDVTYFDLISEYQLRGKGAMNARLLDLVAAEKPDLLFCVLFENELDIDTISRISRETDTVTYNWFCDDHWRFDGFTRYWAPAFNWVSTTAASALPKYRRIGYSNVIKTQWACNHFSYRPVELPLRYDVSFVGQPHGNRRETIEALRASGIRVDVWGFGWERGRLSQDEMVRIFGQSRINLNLANASTTASGRWRRHIPSGRPRLVQQIKGRNFEVPGCGGFLLTEMAENLDYYYTPGQEVGVFSGLDDLVRAVHHYLREDAQRRRIARAGYERTLAEHTYEKRFRDIFRIMGLNSEAA